MTREDYFRSLAEDIDIEMVREACQEPTRPARFQLGGLLRLPGREDVRTFKRDATLEDLEQSLAMDEAGLLSPDLTDRERRGRERIVAIKRLELALLRPHWAGGVTMSTAVEHFLRECGLT
jgi:hypothetical protein